MLCLHLALKKLANSNCYCEMRSYRTITYSFFFLQQSTVSDYRDSLMILAFPDPSILDSIKVVSPGMRPHHPTVAEQPDIHEECKLAITYWPL